MKKYGINKIIDVRFKPAKENEDKGTVFIEFQDGKCAQLHGTFADYCDFINMVENDADFKV